MELDFELTRIGGRWAIALDIPSMRTVIADLNRYSAQVRHPSNRHLFNEMARMRRQTRTELKKAYSQRVR